MPQKAHSMWRLDRTVVVVIAIAVLSILALLIVDHGPWSHPRVETAEVANYRTTGEAARAVGATVVPTTPKPVLEPVPPGPKSVAPANPLTP